ncbi:MAG: hypothetical protein K5886_02720 [Lachnospiraceae bacterium]|nr:hypothetical protein [Lachnospiraceae bacterium]
MIADKAKTDTIPTWKAEIIEKEHIKEVLDKIRAEIEQVVWEDVVVSLDETNEIRIPRLDPDDVFEIIDKYREDGDANG